MKVGDKIICIDNDGLAGNLTVNNSYIIIEILPMYDSCSILGNNIPGIYNNRRFISVKEHRKEKLDKIKNLWKK